MKRICRNALVLIGAHASAQKAWLLAGIIVLMIPWNPSFADCHEGEACCINECRGTALCYQGICRCGTGGFPCCQESAACQFPNVYTCAPTAQYPSGECVPCGSNNQPCCGGTSCSSGYDCDGSKCICGDVGYPCCGSGSCPIDGGCYEGTCIPCGGTNQICCYRPYLSCDDGRSCVDNICRTCGGKGQPCCAGDYNTQPPCGANLDCDFSGSTPTCRCGSRGQVCCTGNSCDEGVCNDGECECGGIGQRCCANNACVDGTCAGGQCSCGNEGQPCCPGSACNGTLTCNGSACVQCGLAGNPCCDGTSCSDGSTCINGNCDCGGDGEPCCANQTCDSGLACGPEGQCTACGGYYEPCCAGESCENSSLRCVRTNVGTPYESAHCQSCGYSGDPCCNGYFQCNGYQTICHNDVCTSCGEDGSPCCDYNQCNGTDSFCKGNGNCGKCGEPTAPCCEGSTCSFAFGNLSNDCLNGTCTSCGYPGQRCCDKQDLPQCLGTSCVDGQCICGGLNQACCPSTDPQNYTYHCDTGLLCGYNSNSAPSCKAPTASPTATTRTSPVSTPTRTSAVATPTRTSGNGTPPTATRTGQTSPILTSTPTRTHTALPTITPTTSPTPTSTVCSGQILPFHCYNTMVLTTHAEVSKLTLADDLSVVGESLQARLSDQGNLCTGASIDGTPASASSQALQRYKLYFPQLKSRLRLARLLPRAVQATNQFGTTRLRLRSLDHVLIDTGISTRSLPSAPSSPTSLNCYRVQRDRGQAASTHTVTVTDRFATSSARLGEARLLCVPSQTNGAPRPANCRPDSLLCYRAQRLSRSSLLGRLFTSNQFGNGSHYVRSASLVCVPSSFD